MTARKRQETTRLVVTLCVGVLGLKSFRLFFKSEKERIRARDRIKFLLVGIMFKYRRRMKRFGQTGELRQRRLVRNVMTSHTCMTHHRIMLRTTRDHLLPFLKEYQYR